MGEGTLEFMLRTVMGSLLPWGEGQDEGRFPQFILLCDANFSANASGLEFGLRLHIAKLLFDTDDPAFDDLARTAFEEKGLALVHPGYSQNCPAPFAK
jgi:hypothetical protein